MADAMNPMTGSEIAVIGMACRFPGASNINEFWANLKNGVESISFFSDEEISALAQEIEPGFLENPDFVKTRGGVLKDKEFFDASFFGYTPKEAEVLDPQIRVFSECVWTALEDAGYDPGRYDGFIGLYAGAGESSYWEYLTVLSGKYKNLGAHTAGHLASKDYLSTQIAYKLNLKGPCFSVQTACSTSLTAIHLACQGILNYECNMALAGGVKILHRKLDGYIYEEGMINSPDGHCRAFDAKAKGTVSAEGAGVVLLKLLENAIADGDHIYAVIKGAAINNDGWRKVGYTAPSIDGQAEVIGMAQRTAEVEPETIGYIEAHGTGTELGDPVEIEALKLAFNTDKRNFCGIGSLKTNIGHMDAAAGVGGFIKTALALNHRLLPPSLHFETPNPRIDFKNSPFYVVTQLKEWDPISNHPLRAGVSSFGFGGTNAHIVLEEYMKGALFEKTAPFTPAKTFDYLILLSAKSQSTLEKQTQNLVDFLRKNPHTNLADTSYTLVMGRKHFEHRRMTVCKNVEDAVTLLSNPNSRDVRTNSLKKGEKKVVLMFSGHGSQYPNMTLDLYRHEPFFRETMDQCFHILETKTGLNIKEALYPPDAGQTGEKPNDVLLSGPIKFTIEYSLAKLLMKWGVQPHALIGHSFGEYTAACLSGVFSLEDALSLVALRGKLMEETPPGLMLSVPLPEEELKNLINADISISAVNSPSNCNVSGPVETMEKFERELHENGHECLRLHFPRACHSQMMVPAAAQLAEAIKKIKTNEPTIPYISGLTGDWITADEIADPLYWQKHMVETVRFSTGIKKLLQTPNLIFVQAGCDSGLPLFVGKHLETGNANPHVNLLRNSKENVPDLHYFLNTVGALWLNGIPIDGANYFSQEKPNRISLPTYPFERNYYWIYEPDSIDLEKIRGAIAVTESGKETESEREREKKFISPQEIIRVTGETGRKILEIWRGLLGHEDIGMDDNFFELGGTSLAAMEVKKRIKTIFDIEIPVVKVLHYPTIRSFMENILEIKKEETPRDIEPSLPGNPNQDNIQEELIDVLDKF
ncbi:MAG: phthiocerol/phenolphthiocerol synthesis type-I polyketide synthase [Acidobacteriota bacterium]|nr:phthiocerol/phenolphthiocerol synthesis type-I polyketide synthase [Acidobacteriota bacterium]